MFLLPLISNVLISQDNDQWCCYVVVRIPQGRI
jgi:hypothetical protein